MKFQHARSTFLAYRAGLISFGDVYAAIEDDICAIALSLAVRRGARMHADDVAQEIAIAAWRALDNWDSSRGTSIESHVAFRARNAGMQMLNREASVTRLIEYDYVTDDRDLDAAIAMAPTQESTISLRETITQSPAEFAELAAHVAEAGGEICIGLKLFLCRTGSPTEDTSSRAKALEVSYRREARRLGPNNIEAR